MQSLVELWKELDIGKTIAFRSFAWAVGLTVWCAVGDLTSEVWSISPVEYVSGFIVFWAFAAILIESRRAAKAGGPGFLVRAWRAKKYKMEREIERVEAEMARGEK